MRQLAFVGFCAVIALTAVSVVQRGRRGSTATHGAKVERLTVRSRFVGRDLHDVVVVPAGGGKRRPLLVFLHGRGRRADSNLTQQLFDGLKALGARAPVVLLPDGGDHSYWHDRRGGRWGSSVLRESIPGALYLSHADSRRVAIGGISMGGFGALDLARLAARRFCAVGAHSAALWFSGGDTPTGAFDDAEDFSRHDLIAFARRHALFHVPTWIDVGRDDPFARADTALAHELQAHGVHVVFHLHGGGHSGWSHRTRTYLRWYAVQLARCASSGLP